MNTKKILMKIPEVGFIASTRVALGAGLGLILSDKLSRNRRKTTGWTLLAIGAATTVPVIVTIVRRAKQLDTAAA